MQSTFARFREHLKSLHEDFTEYPANGYLLLRLQDDRMAYMDDHPIIYIEITIESKYIFVAFSNEHIPNYILKNEKHEWTVDKVTPLVE